MNWGPVIPRSRSAPAAVSGKEAFADEEGKPQWNPGDPNYAQFPSGPKSGMFYYLSYTRMRDVTDGLTNTLAVGERGQDGTGNYGTNICAGFEGDAFLPTGSGLIPPSPCHRRRLRQQQSQSAQHQPLLELPRRRHPVPARRRQRPLPELQHELRDLPVAVYRARRRSDGRVLTEHLGTRYAV